MKMYKNAQKVFDPLPEPDSHQNLMGAFLTHTTSFHQVVW